MYLYESRKDLKSGEGMHYPSFTRMIMGARTANAFRLPFWKKASIELFLYQFEVCKNFAFFYYYDDEGMLQKAFYSYSVNRMRVK